MVDSEFAASKSLARHIEVAIPSAPHSPETHRNVRVTFRSSDSDRAGRRKKALLNIYLANPQFYPRRSRTTTLGRKLLSFGPKPCGEYAQCGPTSGKSCKHEMVICISSNSQICALNNQRCFRFGR